MLWIIVPVVAILAPFLLGAYSKWINLQKMRMKHTIKMSDPLTEEHAIRLDEAEDALEAAQRRIENLESIVVARLLEAPPTKDTIKIEASELIASKQPKADLKPLNKAIKVERILFQIHHSKGSRRSRIIWKDQ